MTHTWDPDRYLAYADERGRPFVELLSRIDAGQVGDVVDLGCGPGNLTRLLTERWPAAEVTGVDSSPEMIERARTESDRVRFEVGDLRTWAPAAPVDVLISNATLQWVPGHLDLLPRLVGSVKPRGWFAFQVPGNFDSPSHVLTHELGAEPPYAGLAANAAWPEAFDAATYLEALIGLGCEVDAWETTYLHLLHGEDPVFTWISATGARPTLQALDPAPALRASYEAELKRRLRAAYPARGYGVLMPFRRVFVVARVPGAQPI
jgi:trans-aconitate 2-methyltransferase